MVSPIVSDTYDNIHKNALPDYENQRKLAITLVAVGIVLGVGASIALYHSSGLTQTFAPAIRASFGVLVGISCIVTLSPLRQDWTPYHARHFYDRVHKDFRKFGQKDPELKAFSHFLHTYYFDKLETYGYITPSISELCVESKDVCKSKVPDEIRGAISKWNQRFR